MEKLQAVNAMLASIAQMPENSVDSLNPYVIAAVAVIDRVSPEIQEVGWWFNTDYNVTLIPTEDGEILLPQSTLKIDSLFPKMQFVSRNNKLFDPMKQTGVFSTPITANIIVELPFDYLPNAAATYIMRKSIREFFADRDGDPAKLARLDNDSQMAGAHLMSEGVQQLGISASDSPAVRGFMSRQHRSNGMIMPSLSVGGRTWAGR